MNGYGKKLNFKIMFMSFTSEVLWMSWIKLITVRTSILQEISKFI